MRWPALVLIPTLILSSGCITLPGRNDVNEIDTLVANQYYGRALDILARIDPKSPDYSARAERRRHIETLAARYEQAIRTQTREDMEKGNWAAALDRYDDALTRLPQSMVLRDGLAQLLQQQNQELERLELERLTAQGNWLRQTLPSYREIVRVNPRSRPAAQQLERKQQQAEAIADQLAVIGNRAMANNDLNSASKTLLLAHELSNTPAIVESVGKLQQQLEARRLREQREREVRLQKARTAEQTRQQQIRQQHSQYRKARNDEQFNQAREHLQRLRELDPDNSDWHTEQDVLEQVVQLRIEELYNRGVNAYSRGQFEEAANAWRELLKLDPDHKLAQDNLIRAERVLQRIEQLQQRQSN